MGKFSYDGKITVDFDDRVMAHLQAVIATKLRRGESFVFTWIDDDSIGDGHTSIWLNPSSTISFKYFGKRGAAINRAWIEQMMVSANSNVGLRITPEPPEHATTPDHEEGER